MIEKIIHVILGLLRRNWSPVLIIIGLELIRSKWTSNILARFKWYRRLVVRRYGLINNIKYVKVKAYVILECIIGFLLYLQIRFKFKILNFYHVKLDMIISLYSFIVAVLALYGIYLAFLQFLIDKSDTYLGKNKTKYIVNYSNFYQITQTKIFILILFIFTFSPIVLIKCKFIYLLYLWQTICVTLLILYLFLIELDLKAIYVLFLVKENTDVGLKRSIEYQVMYRYFVEWKKVISNQTYLEYLYFLKLDLSKISKVDITNFLNKIFLENQFLLVYKLKMTQMNSSYANMYFKKKWRIINQYKKYIDVNIYENLLKDDITTIISLWSNARKNGIQFQSIFKRMFENLVKEFFDNYSAANSNEEIFEFNQIKDKNLKNIINKIEVECLVNKYLISNDKPDILELLAMVNMGNVQNELFYYLTEHVHKVRQDKKYANLLKKLDYVHYVTFLLYELVYPDEDKNFDWTDNFLKISKTLERKLMPFSKEYQIKMGNLLDHTCENNRINSAVLDNIIDDSGKSISQNTYFDKFNKSRLSKLVVLYTELIFRENLYFSNFQNIIRVSSSTLKSRIELSEEYLAAISKNTNLLEEQSLERCMHTIIQSIDLTDKVQYLDVTGLLYLDFVYSNSRFSMKKIMLSIISRKRNYHFTKNIFDFFILKLNKMEYEYVFSNKIFLYYFKKSGISILDRANCDVEEYLNLLQHKLNNSPQDVDYIYLGDESKKIICDKLTKILEK